VWTNTGWPDANHPEDCWVLFDGDDTTGLLTADGWTTKRTYPISSIYRYMRITNWSAETDHLPQTLSFGAEPTVQQVIPTNMTGPTTGKFSVWTNTGWPAPNHPERCWMLFDGHDNTGNVTANDCQVPFSAALGVNNYVAVDLGKSYALQNYTLYSQYTVGSGVGTAQWTIQGSIDNNTWVNLSSNFTSDAWTTKRTYPLSGNYRYMRITNWSAANDHLPQTLNFGVMG
jgi:hypothetical protein